MRLVATHGGAPGGVVARPGSNGSCVEEHSGACSGAVAGLVGITPASGSVTPIAAIVLGFAAGLICFLGVHVLEEPVQIR